MKYLTDHQCREALTVARQGLEKYGVHKSGCDYYRAWPNDALCTCGLDDMLDKIKDPNDA